MNEKTPLQSIRDGLSEISSIERDLKEIHGDSPEVQDVVSLSHQLKAALDKLRIPELRD